MTLDIGIADGSSYCPQQDEPSLQLDDGYYWFLHSLLEELAMATGQYIDLYGDASFTGKDLAALEEMLKHAWNLVESQPANWDVCIGRVLVPHQKDTGTRPHLKEMSVAVEKSHFI